MAGPIGWVETKANAVAGGRKAGQGRRLDRRGGRWQGGAVDEARRRPLREEAMRYPVTPDGRYFVVRGRLWRCSDPTLDDTERVELTRALMAARRLKGVAMRRGDAAGREAARAAVDAAKTGLGERGPPWWTDGAPDYNRRMAAGTPYAGWWAALATDG